MSIRTDEHQVVLSGSSETAVSESNYQIISEFISRGGSAYSSLKALADYRYNHDDNVPTLMAMGNLNSMSVEFDILLTLATAGSYGFARSGSAFVSKNFVDKTTINTFKAVRSALANRSGKRGFNEVGFQFQKHFGRGVQGWKNNIPIGAKLNPKTFNKAGYRTFKEIWRAPGEFKRVGGFIEKRLPDGRGIRLQENWKFKGFID